jgi:hypothetical protein
MSNIDIRRRMKNERKEAGLRAPSPSPQDSQNKAQKHLKGTIVWSISIHILNPPPPLDYR